MMIMIDGLQKKNHKKEELNDLPPLEGDEEEVKEGK